MTFSRLHRPLVFAATIAVFALALSTVGGPVAEAGQKKTSEAGGKAIAHQNLKKVSGSPKLAPSPKFFRHGLTSGEPTIGVTNDGSIFTPGFVTNTRVEVMRSQDQGKTWETASPNIGGRNTHVLTLDPYVYVDNRLGDKDSSRVFTIDLTVDCSILSFSDDSGDSWVTNPLACGRPVNDHQTLFTGPPVSSPTIGYENIVYYCWNDVASSSCSKSLDGGITFAPTGSPAFPGYNPTNEDPGFLGVNGFCGGLHGHGFADTKGTIYVPRGYCGKALLAISKDEGRTWDTVRVDGGARDGDADPSVVVDEKGNIYYLFIGSDRMPYLTTSTNGGKKWSKPVAVGSPGINEANLPSIDVGAPGKVAFLYMGTENGPNKPKYGKFCREKCPENEDYEDTTWNAYMGVSYNALDKNPTFYTTTANNKKDPLLRGRCGPGRCSGRIPGILDFLDMVIDPEGQPWASLVDECVLICTQGGGNDGGEGVVATLIGPRLK